MRQSHAPMKRLLACVLSLLLLCSGFSAASAEEWQTLIITLSWLDSEGESSVVSEHIRRIRVKLAACGAQPYIETVWGCGYKWKR